MKSLIRITLPEEQASVHAELLWKEAPNTMRRHCERTACPWNGPPQHLFRERLLRPPRENATSKVPGDIAFHADGCGFILRCEIDFAEVC
jgi:hypothetical protein